MENLSIYDLPTEILASIALWLRQDTLDFRCFVLLTSRLLRTKIGSTPIINKFEYLKSHKSNKTILIDWKAIIKHFPLLQHFSTNYWPSSKSNSSFTHSCLFHIPRYRICTLHLEFDDSLQACFVRQKLPNSNHSGNWIPFNFEAYFPQLTDLRIIGNQLDNSIIAPATWVDLIYSLPRNLHSLGLGMVNLNQDALSNLPPSLTSLTWHGLPIGGATLNDAKLGSLKFLAWLPSNHKIIDFLISIPPCCTHVTLIDAPWTDECASVMPRTVEHLVLSTAQPSHPRREIASNCDFTPRAILMLPSTLKTLKIHAILKEFHRWTPEFFDNMVSHFTSLETFEWRFPSLGEQPSDYCAVPSSLTHLSIDNRGQFGRLWNMNEWPVGLGFVDTGPNSLSREVVSAMLRTPFANLHTLHVCADVFNAKTTYQLLPRTLIVLKLLHPNISDYSISLLPRGLKCLHILTDYDYGVRSNAQLSDLCFEDLPRGLTDLKIEAGRLCITGQPAARFLARKGSSSLYPSTVLVATRTKTMNRETTFQPKSSFRIWDRTTCLENCLLDLPSACRDTFRLYWSQPKAYHAHNACVLLTLSNFPENFVTHIALPALNLCPSVWLKCYASIINVNLENENSEHLAILLKRTPLGPKIIPSAFSSLSSITAHVDTWLLEGMLADLPKTVTRLKILRPDWRYYALRYELPAKLLLPTQLKHLSIPTFTTHWAKETLVDTKHLISFEVTQIQSISSKHLVFLPRTLNTFSASGPYDNVYNGEEIPEPMIMDSWLPMLPKTVRNLTFSSGLALTDRAILKHQDRFDKIEVGVLIIKELPLAFGTSLLSQRMTSANYTRSSPIRSPKKVSSAKPTSSTPTSAKKVSTLKLSSSVTPGTMKTPANNSSLPTSMPAQYATAYGRNMATPNSSTSRLGLESTTAAVGAPIVASITQPTAKPPSLVNRPIIAYAKDNPYATISSIVVPSTIVEAQKAIPSFKTLVKAQTILVQWSHLAQIQLPQTLTDLRFTHNDIGTQGAVDDTFVARLPRRVLHLHILTQSGLTSKCISSLPPTLVTLKINARNIPESALMKLPRTLVELTLLGGSHELKSPSFSWPPNLKLLHLLADPSHVSTCHIDDDYVSSMLHGLEDLSITHETLMSCNGLGLLPRSITKLHLNCPLIGEFDVNSLPTDVHNVTATTGTSFEWFLAMKRL